MCQLHASYIQVFWLILGNAILLRAPSHTHRMALGARDLLVSERE
jgi:hypothetical protein